MEKEVFKIFEQLKNTAGSNDKIRIIKENAGKELFVDAIKFLLDTNVTTGLSKVKISKRTNAAPRQIITDLKTAMKYLEKYNTGTDFDIATIQNFINSSGIQDKDMLKEFFTKKLKLGVTVKSLNKAIPCTIETYNVQQGFPISGKNKPRQGEWFGLSQKLNGTNCGVLNKKCLSRQGKLFSNMYHIVADLEKIGLGEMFVNGELIRKNVDNLSDDQNFQKSCSIINSDLKDKSEIKLVIYEVLTVDEFRAGKSNDTYKIRLGKLKELDKKIKEFGLENIEIVRFFYDGTNQNEIQKWLDYADENNMEGLMLNKDTYWENKRSNGLLKVKSFHDIDLRVLSVNIAEDGKYKGTLGSVTCKFYDNTVDVGSGFNDDERNMYRDNPDKIIGKIVTVRYKVMTTNKEGGKSLQFPTWTHTVRFDKDIATDEE